MIQLILTEEQQRLLDQSNEPVQVVDRTGRLLASVPVEASEEELAEAHQIAAEFDDLTGTSHGLSDADLDRIAQSSREFKPGDRTLRVLIDQLKNQTTVSAR